MGGHNIRGTSYYRCYNKTALESMHYPNNTGPDRCNCREVKAQDIEKLVWEEITRLINNPVTLIEALHNRNDDTSATREATERELQLCENRLKAIPIEQKRLVEGYRKGLYPDFMMREEMERTDKEQKNLESRKTELQKQLNQRVITANQEQAIKDFANRISAGLENVDFAGKQQIVRLLVEKISYGGNSIEIQTIINPDVQLHPVHFYELIG
jgi:site-specific DNA recombinase